MSKPTDFKDLCDLGNAAQRATEAACQECVKRDASLETQPLCFLIYGYPYVDFSDVNGRPVWCFATLSGGFFASAHVLCPGEGTVKLCWKSI